jgi:glycosyltransferase involved in cell wall biosynthesis
MGKQKGVQALVLIGGSVKKKKVLLRGPLLTRSGYGEQARFALRSLRSQPEACEVFIQPTGWGKTSWVNIQDEERLWIDQTIEKTIAYIQQGGQFDISVQVTIPNEFEKVAPINIGYTAGIETTRVAHEWLLKANETVDKIIVVSNHSKNVLENTEYVGRDERTNQEVRLTLAKPTYAVNYPVKKYENLPELELELKHDTNFLAVAQFGPRKNVPNTVKWFMEEFKDDDVGLVLKTNIAKNCLMDREKIHNDLKQFLSSYKDHKCKVYVIHGNMTDEELHALYVHPKIKAFLTLAHGEGFGLPIFEAAYSGLPVVSPGWSGQMDFLCDTEGKEHFYNVPFDLQRVQPEVVWPGVIVADSMWAYAREEGTKSKMRQCYDDIVENSGYVAASCEYATELMERFEESKMYEQFVSLVLPLDEMKEEAQKIDDLLSDLL